MKVERTILPPPLKLVVKSPAEIDAMSYEKQRAYSARIMKASREDHKIKRPRCSVCNDRLAFWHHEDYRFPLAVVPFCTPHHLQRHDALKWGQINGPQLEWTLLNVFGESFPADEIPIRKEQAYRAGVGRLEDLDIDGRRMVPLPKIIDETGKRIKILSQRLHALVVKQEREKTRAKAAEDRAWLKGTKMRINVI